MMVKKQKKFRDWMWLWVQESGMCVEEWEREEDTVMQVCVWVVVEERYLNALERDSVSKDWVRECYAFV